MKLLWVCFLVGLSWAVAGCLSHAHDAAIGDAPDGDTTPATETGAQPEDGGDATTASEITETEVADEVGPSCHSGLAQPTPECEACQDTHCCISASAAVAEPGVWTRSAAKICRLANCAEVCGADEPLCGGIEPDPASCTDALYAQCCDQVSACAHDDECVAVIYLCIDDQGCVPGSACFKTCTAKYPNGRKLFDKLNNCYGNVACP